MQHSDHATHTHYSHNSHLIPCQSATQHCQGSSVCNAPMRSPSSLSPASPWPPAVLIFFSLSKHAHLYLSHNISSIVFLPFALLGSYNLPLLFKNYSKYHLCYRLYQFLLKAFPQTSLFNSSQSFTSLQTLKISPIISLTYFSLSCSYIPLHHHSVPPFHT